MSSKNAMASVSVTSPSATMSTVCRAVSMVQLSAMLCRLRFEPAARGPHLAKDLDRPVGRREGAEQPGQAVGMLGQRHNRESAHRPVAVIGADARAQQHHFLVVHR